MSHPVNDEILENLYEEVKEEFPNALEPFVIAEAVSYTHLTLPTNREV